MMPTKERRRPTICRSATCRPTDEAGGPDLFERLVRIMKENERLLLELKALDARIGAARAYLAGPGCHLPLALGNLAHLRTKRSGLLTLLRAGRIAAEAIVGPLEPAAPAPTH